MSEQIVKFGRFMVDSFVLWKLSFAKSMMHSLVAMIIAFTGMQAVATQAEWDSMWWMKRWQFWATILAIGIKDLISFFDQTTNMLKKQLGEDTGMTEIIGKDQ